MPREVVYGDQTPFGDEGPARSTVEVTWSREAEHVQIVSKCVDAATGETFDPSGGQEPSVPGLPTMYDGMYVTLDRSGINRLIRNLRRARDQAFGRDE